MVSSKSLRLEKTFEFTKSSPHPSCISQCPVQAMLPTETTHSRFPSRRFSSRCGAEHLVMLIWHKHHFENTKVLWRRQSSTGNEGQRPGGSADNSVSFMCWVPLSEQMLLQRSTFPPRSITANSVAWGYVWLHRCRADVPASLLLACSRGIWLSWRDSGQSRRGKGRGRKRK